MVSGFILFGLLWCFPCMAHGVGLDRILCNLFSPMPWRDMSAVLQMLMRLLVSANQSINQSIHNWGKK